MECDVLIIYRTDLVCLNTVKCCSVLYLFITPKSGVRTVFWNKVQIHVYKHSLSFKYFLTCRWLSKFYKIVSPHTLKVVLQCESVCLRFTVFQIKAKFALWGQHLYNDTVGAIPVILTHAGGKFNTHKKELSLRKRARKWHRLVYIWLGCRSFSHSTVPEIVTVKFLLGI